MKEVDPMSLAPLQVAASLLPRRRHALRRPRPALLAVVLLLFPLACATSPTGRTQILIQPEPEMARMGIAAFDQMKAEKPVVTGTGDAAFVDCVADAIVAVLTPEDTASIYVERWEVELFQDPSANAFALPGGKMGVNTGMLGVARGASQLAAVMGHEVGHVLARHSNERVSQSTLAQVGMNSAATLLGTDTPAKQQLMGLLGVGMQYGVLMPYGRTQESEADSIGLELMARAGFDPREAVGLWQNMARAGGGQAPPEFMSTHPSHQTRIDQLQQAMPDALQVYERARANGRRPTCQR